MKGIFKNFFKALGMNISDGSTKDFQSSGCKNTMKNTNISSNFSDEIYTKTNKMTETTQKTFQWLKGEKAGEFVRWNGEIHNDGYLNFLIFEDGSRANEELLGDYFIEVAGEHDGFVDIEMMKPQPTFQPLPQQHNPPLQRVNASADKPFEPNNRAPENPISRLLLDSKKVNTKIKLDLELDIPSSELMKVLADSYEEGEEHVLEFLASTISVMRMEAAKQIWSDIKKKQKSNKNETT